MHAKRKSSGNPWMRAIAHPPAPQHRSTAVSLVDDGWVVVSIAGRFRSRAEIGALRVSHIADGVAQRLEVGLGGDGAVFHAGQAAAVALAAAFAVSADGCVWHLFVLDHGQVGRRGERADFGRFLEHVGRGMLAGSGCQPKHGA